MKKLLLIAGLLLVAVSCDQINVTTLTIDGAVLYYESATKLTGAYGVFVVAKANLDYYDRNALPTIEPSPDDTSGFPKLDMPSFLTPEKNAQVNVNGSSLTEAFDGQYQGEISNLHPGDTVNLFAATQEGDTGKATMVIPGGFSLNLSDTAFIYDSITSIDLAWTQSKNANAYMVMVYSIDTASSSTSLLVKQTTEDTTFSISKDDLNKGQYLIQVASIYGKLNASMPQAGTLIGVLGQVATLYVKRPILIVLN